MDLNIFLQQLKTAHVFNLSLNEFDSNLHAVRESQLCIATDNLKMNVS